MPIPYAHPRYQAHPGDGSSTSFTREIRPERVRFVTYLLFYGLVLLAKLMERFFVTDILLQGAVEEPAARLGCGPFNREGGEFNLSFGEGFVVETQSHLLQNFGFNNICVSWDYTPSREIVAMYFPLFEYALVIYLFLDFVNTMMSYRRGELPGWFWKITMIITPINMILCAWFRLIFVFLAYEQTRFHTMAFLGLQIALISVAIMNVGYVVLTGQDYTDVVRLDRRATAIVAWVYLACNLAISSVKIYATIYIVSHPDVISPPFYKYKTPFGDMVLGKLIDLIWMIFNALLPTFIAFVRYRNEDPLVLTIDVPLHDYTNEGEDSSNPQAPRRASETSRLVE